MKVKRQSAKGKSRRMNSAMNTHGVKEIVEVSSSFWKMCPYCPDLKLSEDSIEQQVNHYLRHGLKLLHIGTESSRTAEGEVWNSTVAILGKFD